MVVITDIKVSSAGILEWKNRGETSCSSMENAVNSLEEGLCALSGMWSGDAKEAFENTFRQDLLEVRELLLELHQLLDREGQGVAEYENCIRDVGEYVSQMPV
ncbi:MAG: hypothetical protein Q4B26_08140 [Eubacteriales bacterium]|nr:hypothetical protein [Eubacteriales bacterium]